MRILHFSDVHLDPRDKEAARVTIERMITCIKKYYGELASFDLVVFSGDMIQRGGIDEHHNVVFTLNEGFEAFREVVINPICKALKIPVERFIITMGNHDTDWQPVDDSIKKGIDKISTDTGIYSFYHEYIDKDNASWINEFNRFRDSLYASADYSPKVAYANIIHTIGGKKIGISILNSAWASHPKAKQVLLEREQIAASRDYLQSKGCDYKMCVMHNPYHSLSEQELIRVRKMLLENYDVCLTGHTHQPEGVGIVKQNEICYLCTAPKLCSGGKDYTEHDRRYINGFVVFEDDGNTYREAKYIYSESREYELYGEIEETPKRAQRSVKNIAALFELDKELRVKDFAFLRNSNLDAYIDEITGDTHQFVRVSALSGFGKTRLLYEAFLPQKEKLLSLGSNAYYCESYPDEKMVLNEIKSIVESNLDKTGLIILDDCKKSLMYDAVTYMSSRNTRMRLIVVDGDPYDNSEIAAFHHIRIEPDIIKDMVDEHIDAQLSSPRFFERKEDVKRLADGSPYMAYELVKKCLEDGKVGITSINEMVQSLLAIDNREESDDYQRVLQAMALFQPMPTEEGDKEAYDFIVSNNLITHLKDSEIAYRKDIFYRVIRRYEHTLLDCRKDWLVVRPYPLAVWLIQEWFKIINSERDFDLLLAQIAQQPERVRNTLSEGLFSRIETMQESTQAKVLIGKLTGEKDSLFRSEKVVCSEMGSRLFLAMCTVNPEKVAECLRVIFQAKDSEWIRENVKDKVRRNLVMALNKLCFARESYDDAVVVMAQFAEAENEHWSNNSRSGITQLFPVQLPDTEVDLGKRADTLGMLWNKGYKALALASINVAFKNNSFMRMSGAERFGWRHRDPYIPGTYGEIYRYWDRCVELLVTWYQEDNLILKDAIDIIEKHVSDWRSYGLMEKYLFRLLDTFGPIIGWQWNKMYELLNQALRFQRIEYTKVQKNRINTYILKLTPTSFADVLQYTSRKVFDYEGDAKDDMYARAHELLRPLAERFVNEELYRDEKEVNGLIVMQNGEGLFIQELKELITEEQLAQLFAIVWQNVEEKKDEFSSAFVNGILYGFKENKIISQYINRLLTSGYKCTYVRAMAAVEDASMTSYKHLLTFYKNGELTYDHIVMYMGSLWGLTNEQMQIILPSLMENFTEHYESVLGFVMKHRFWTNALGEEMHDDVRELLLQAPWVNEQNNSNYEVISLVHEYLKKYKEKDVDFGVQVNRKIIQLLGEKYVHNDNIPDLYGELLQEPYQSAIWEEFSDALVNNIAFFMSVQYTIGSGFSFGAGPLFQYVPDERLKELCVKNENAIHYLACMAPVFKYGENSKIEGFSDFLTWMIETYGQNEATLSGISSNMNTMSWTGSTIPLHEDMVDVLTPYVNHKYAEVQKWAVREIDYLRQQIDREKSQEDYMRMHYN